MTHIREGARVSYVGDDVNHGVSIGDQGQVIASSGGASHVRWASGQSVGQMHLVSNADLVEARRLGSLAESVDDALLAGPLVRVSVRDTYDLDGPEGLLSALSEDGHLAVLADLAEEALGAMAGRLRSDPSIAEVLASLEPEEQEAFVTHTASALLLDAAQGGE